LDLNQQGQVVLEPSAVGASEQTVRLVRGAESGWTYVATSADDQTQPARMTTIDAYASEHGVEMIDVLKLDVEGYELYALHGAERMLNQHSIAAIVCELNDFVLARNNVNRADVLSFLGDHDYSPHPISPTGLHRFRRPSTLEAASDLLFTRSA
jgi:hypothetical protein